MPARRVPGLIALADVDLLVVFNPETPDRTAAIDGRGPSPLPWLRDSARLLQQMGASHLAYPCNTAHYFLHHASPAELPLSVPLVDLIDETVQAAASAGYRRVGLLASTGTVRSGLYQTALERRGLEVLLPSTSVRRPAPGDTDANGRARPELFERFGATSGGPLPPAQLAPLLAALVDGFGEQEGLVMETIIGVMSVKAGFVTGLVQQIAHEAARRLATRGADALLLGCTELPIAITGERFPHEGRQVALLDPTQVMADRLRALGGHHGIAGGLGPAATVDLLLKMNAPVEFTNLQRDILRATVDVLGARRDQDHLKMLAIAGPDPLSAAKRLAQAGADFLVLAPGVASQASAIEAAARLPVITARPGQRVGPDVVRQAALAPIGL